MEVAQDVTRSFEPKILLISWGFRKY